MPPLASPAPTPTPVDLGQRLAHEVDAALVGQSVTLRHDPSAPASRGIEDWHEGRFVERARPARRRRLLAFSALVLCVFFTILTVLSGRVVWDDLQYGETSPGIGVPIWWYSMWTPILSLAIAGRALGVMLRADS